MEKLKPTSKKINLEYIAGRWWFYLLLFILYFIPPYTSKGYDPLKTQDAVFEILRYSLPPYRWLAPFFHIATILLIVGLYLFRDSIKRILTAYISINFFFIAFAQNIAFTEKYGLGILFGGIICFSVIGIFWAWEAIAGKSDFTYHKTSTWKYWVVPLALLAFWAPPKPDFNLVYLLKSYYGLAFCLTTPVILAIFLIYYPGVNIAVLRVTSFMGTILGALNISMILLGYNIWVSGILHIPLFTTSLFCLILSLKRRSSKNRERTDLKPTE